MVAGAHGGPTEAAYRREVCWSTYWLYICKHPDRNSQNRMYTPEDPEYGMRLHDLAGGFYGIWWMIQADLDLMLKRSNSPDDSSAGEPCSGCEANNTDAPWMDWRPVARWTSRRWTSAGYDATHPDQHVLLRMVPGMTVFSYVPDVMH